MARSMFLTINSAGPAGQRPVEKTSGGIHLW
jgi:hypothetical protein